MAKSATPVTDVFGGGRFGAAMDPFGHARAPATHMEDLTPSQFFDRAMATVAQVAAGKPA